MAINYPHHQGKRMNSIFPSLGVSVQTMTATCKNIGM